jgi:hypothetical protein
VRYSDKALTYLKRFSEQTTKSIPDSIYILSSEDHVPPGVDETKCIIIGDKLDTKDVINLANATGVGHVVQVSEPNFEKEIQVAVRMITNPDTFTSNPATEILGTNRLDAQNNEMRWSFHALKQKEEVKKEIGTYIDHVPSGQLIKNEALSIVDELFTNALLHSSPKELTLAELRELDLDDHLAPWIFAAHGNGRFVVGCIDHFGNLNTGKLLRHLWASYRGYKIQSIKMGTGGAGIGFRLILNQCIGFYAGVKQSERTVICAVLSLDRSSKFTLEQSKNIHLTF